MIQLFKAKSLKKTQKKDLISDIEEKSQEKAILKEGIGVNGKLTCTRRERTRGFSFATHTPSKMGFSASGRSMVEMLGVLAIIGVLSIGGIQGYTIAMRKYKANEIMNIANKYAFILYQSCITAMEKDPNKYYISDLTYPYLEAKNFGLPEIGIDEGHRTYVLPWKCPSFISFSNSNLSSLPQGTNNISATNIYSLATSYISDNETLWKKSNLVVLEITFDSSELCNTICTTFNLENCNCSGQKLGTPGCYVASYEDDDGNLICADDLMIPADTIATGVFIEN